MRFSSPMQPQFSFQNVLGLIMVFVVIIETKNNKFRQGLMMPIQFKSYSLRGIDSRNCKYLYYLAGHFCAWFTLV